MSTGLSCYSETLIEARAGDLQAAFYTLMADESFNEAISLGTNQVSRVRTRFELTNYMLREVLGAPTN